MAYIISGKVVDSEGTPLIRKVVILDKDTLIKIGEVYSKADGTYSYKQLTPDSRLVLIKAEDLDESNSLVMDRVVPVNDGIPVAADIDKIGIRGSMGFGQGVCNNMPSIMVPMDGCYDPYSPNYGNYKVIVDGSIMVWIPKFYYKWGTGSNGLDLNDCDIAGTNVYADETAANLDGYALHRAFIDGGQVKDGFFIDKYKCSKHPTLTIASSLNYAKPMGTDRLTTDFGMIANQCAYLIPTAKLRGDGFHCQSIFQRNAVVMLSYAHGKATTDTNVCAWSNPTYNFVRGDNSVSASVNAEGLQLFKMRDSYTLQGNGSHPMETITHNGQTNGVSNISGTAWEMVIGLTYFSSPAPIGFYTIKESIAMKDITEGTTGPLDHWDTAKRSHDILGTELSDFGTGTGWIYYSNTNQIFDENTDRTSIEYKQTSMGICKPGVSVTTDPKYMGGGIYKLRINQLAPFVSGDANVTSGPWCLALSYGQANYNVYHGFRSAFYIP